MKTVTAVTLAVLVTVELTTRTAHGETPENAKAFCSLTESFCSNCQNLCGSRTYRNGKYFYSSGCGEFCKEQNGTVEIIDFSRKRLNTLGPEIGSLTGLKELYLQYNSLTELPSTISSLINLETL